MLRRINEWITGRSRLALAAVLVLLLGISAQGLRHAWVQERARTFARLDVLAELSAEWLRTSLEDEVSQSCAQGVTPQTCDAWLAELELPVPFSIAVFDQDLVLLGRHPAAPGFTGEVVAAPFLQQAIVEGRAPPRIRTHTPLDGSDRFFVTRPVSGHDLHVVVGTLARPAMAPWRAAVWVHLLAFFFLVFLSVHLFRRHQHLKRARAESEAMTSQVNALNRELEEEVRAQRHTAGLLERNLAAAKFLARISRILVAPTGGNETGPLRAALRATAEYYRADTAALLVLGASRAELLAFELVGTGPRSEELESNAPAVAAAYLEHIGLLRRHLQDRRLFLVNDTAREDAPFAEERETLRSFGVRGVLMGRLVTREGVLGLLVLQRFQESFCTSSETSEFLETVCDQLSEAVGRMLGTQQAQESERRFGILFDSSNAVPIEGVDAEGNICFWSAASERLYGVSREEAFGRPLVDRLATPEDGERFLRWLDAARRNAPDAPVRTQLAWRRPEGEVVRVLSQHITFRPPGHPAEFYCVDTDLSPQLSLQEKLRAQATSDELTGLPNRRDFLVQARRELLRARRMNAPLTLLMADLDHFKRINDRFGHQAGDTVLCAVSRIFRHALRSSDIVARMGGEEFAILLPLTDPEAALQTAERLRCAVAESEFTHREERIKVRVSLGIAHWSASPAAEINCEEELDALLAAADRALYAAKRAGRNCCRSAATGEGGHG